MKYKVTILLDIDILPGDPLNGDEFSEVLDKIFSGKTPQQQKELGIIQVGVEQLS